MEKKQDQYRTVRSSKGGILYKEKNSKFLGYAFHVENETEIKQILVALRNEHLGANHVCYAWQLGVEEKTYRANDDGEPNHSAGTPIYGQIQAFEVTNVLVAVVRYFGGTKLGVGGLISAYRTTAQMALNEAKIIQKTLLTPLSLEYDYISMNKVMRIIKKHSLQIESQTMEMQCKLVLSIPKSDFHRVKNLFASLHLVNVKD
ncbi:MAG: YigZ family protein [Eudoraea sp.]|nr:YigZ family protein [Eudoraea sp.]